MSRPTIGVVIATPGRRSLLRTINSIQMQGLVPGDDVLIVGDGFDQRTKDIVDLTGPPFRYVATEKTRDWGHSQVNYGLKHVGGDWVVIQDDDDVFLPRAFDEARTIISKLESPRLIIGRVMTPYLGLLWSAPRVEPLDGHCIVVPNDKEKLGYFGLAYAGDQVWLATNINAYEHYVWADRAWTMTRPPGRLWPRLWYADADRIGWFFHREDEGVQAQDYFTALRMARHPGRDEHEHVWKGSIHIEQRVSLEEAMEIVQFAAWAGQGSDVWLKFYRTPATWVEAALASGYVEHTNNEYVHEWPPRRYDEPGKKEDK